MGTSGQFEVVHSVAANEENGNLDSPREGSQGTIVFLPSDADSTSGNEELPACVNVAPTTLLPTTCKDIDEGFIADVADISMEIEQDTSGQVEVVHSVAA